MDQLSKFVKNHRQEIALTGVAALAATIIYKRGHKAGSVQGYNLGLNAKLNRSIQVTLTSDFLERAKKI